MIQNIKVTHYINTKLKPITENNILKYPIYVRVTFERENKRFPSMYPFYLSETEFNELNIQTLLSSEKEYIQHIISTEKVRKITPKQLTNIAKLYDWGIDSVILNVMEKLPDNQNIYIEIKNALIEYIKLNTKISLEALESMLTIDESNLTEVLLDDLDPSIFKNENLKKSIMFWQFYQKVKYKLYPDGDLKIFNWITHDYRPHLNKLIHEFSKNLEVDLTHYTKSIDIEINSLIEKASISTTLKT